MTEWEIQGEELANCNCNFGCPCQFSVLPSHGNCEAVVVFDIKTGHYGDTDLAGVRAAGVYHWPGPIHEGNGQMQLIVDEGASTDQRAAIEAIMKGEDTDEMATMWYVFSAMAPTKHETLYVPIELDWNRDERTGYAKVSGVFDVEVSPIPHIVSGMPHRASIHLPNGFEYRHAEAASGSAKTTGGAISLTFDATHAHLAHLNLSGHGVLGA
ncbi:DUF1326 domain-containing protein [Ruegeria profundi]|uniref:DUF1326 domain-containing protein n=1 Tax=Ruegeria profundi TaxID=1685378 RepID=A0A0X3TV89_9RHOB|nr:DUF1326 domain-containing protein [Ruegeria profundi]KUJ79612.1 hypothetical protein AVO44_09565 [Ruegeria profundi]MCA0929042.1 DUF1326 domain-containing protein [Ruegeria profundi]